MYACGLRISEAANLEVTAIDGKSGLVRVIGKGNKERQIPLPEAVLNELRRLWKTHRHPRWLCPGKHRNGPITRTALWRTFRAFARHLCTRQCPKERSYSGFAGRLRSPKASFERPLSTLLCDSAAATVEATTEISIACPDPGPAFNPTEFLLRLREVKTLRSLCYTGRTRTAARRRGGDGERAKGAYAGKRKFARILAVLFSHARRGHRRVRYNAHNACDTRQNRRSSGLYSAHDNVPLRELAGGRYARKVALRRINEKGSRWSPPPKTHRRAGVRSYKALRTFALEILPGHEKQLALGVCRRLQI